MLEPSIKIFLVSERFIDHNTSLAIHFLYNEFTIRRLTKENLDYLFQLHRCFYGFMIILFLYPNDD